MVPIGTRSRRSTKFVKQYIPEEHELDDEDIADKRIWSITKMGVTSALVSLSKTASNNMRERIARYIFILNCTNVQINTLSQGADCCLQTH